MDKKSYLQFCRYYKGEETNPYEGKDRTKAMLWSYESVWLREMEKIELDKKQTREHILFEYLEEYLNNGLADFTKMDNIPVSLKALLFNRYAQGSYSMRKAVEPFKAFYKKYYKESTSE